MLMGQNSATRRFTVWWYRVLLLVVFVLLALLLASQLSRATVWFVVPGLACLAAVLVRAARVGSIEFRAHDVVIRGLRTRRLPIARIRNVGITRGGSAALLPWRVPFFQLDDGSIVRADDVRSLREDSVVDRVVEEARRRGLPADPASSTGPL